MRKSWFAFAVLAVAGLGFVKADLQVRQAELAIPFESVKGHLFVVGDHLLFVDEKSPDHSFAINKDSIKSWQREEMILKIITHEPITDRSGERSELVFKLDEILDLEPWLNHAHRTVEPAEVADAGLAPEMNQSFQVRHKHRFNGCQGRLLITETGLVYESVGDLGHSRKWSFEDIKTIKLNNPYQLRIEPFGGNGYSLQLQGQGMDNRTYQSLVDRITAARAGV